MTHHFFRRAYVDSRHLFQNSVSIPYLRRESYQILRFYRLAFELLEKVIPLYEGSYLNFVTRLRHEGITVGNRSVGRFYAGNYLFGHTLYVDGFNDYLRTM